ncbi:MAG: hypothetical protein HC836_27855 [Richelia sp. RM2_1_2]|nr:hypothetical protein [Richelia sp. RM2_1_2]
MIKELTPEQEAKIEYYRDKWINIGLNTEPFTQERAEQIIHAFQKVVLGCPTTPVKIFDSYIDGWEYICEVCNFTEEQKKSFIWSYQEGSFNAPLFSFSDFFVDQGIVKLDKDLEEKFKICADTCELGLIYPLEDVCVVIKKPTKILLNENGDLHSEKEMAFQIGEPGTQSHWGFYALNGVVVPEELALTPSEELSLEYYKTLTNADVKAEFVRKFGVERMLHFGKKLDTYENYDQETHPWWWKSEYELWDMGVLFETEEGLETYQPYLKMKNQTTGIWHVEAVSPECQSLEDAIAERFGGKMMKIVKIS